ncbi:nucleoside-diphosphate sugar epimerase [Photobacterium gaetbulicola]|uniref:Nucleoside-diphosphate sugar epimerase n=1 Tax=Photobacterium gaetbulicola TaxID=1295392 RepID=A0A0B9G9P5_9GAMM|nr:NAD(P)H-binding protein [Photobacterium gaetbulicola]KHT61650.1 nucleoside-diphosphate sugar epimerase [Photobacterium gaetbulicola]
MTGSSAIIAGGSGLVGDELLHLLLNQPEFEAVYALSRRELPLHSSKLHQIIHPELRITEWEDASPTPTVGFICLGTTKKQAGSKKALEAVDYQRVKEVANTMKMLGVRHLVVISSLFASPWSPSHYLRCKGKMEQALVKMGFEHCIFVRPGPLKGDRSQPRKDELLVQGLFDIFHPLVIGPLANLDPIPAEQVAKKMLMLAQEAQRHELPKVFTLSGRMLLDKPAITH